jgi:hypothetical protein
VDTLIARPARRTGNTSLGAFYQVEILLHRDGGKEKPEIFQLAGDTEIRRKMP